VCYLEVSNVHLHLVIVIILLHTLFCSFVAKFHAYYHLSYLPSFLVVVYITLADCQIGIFMACYNVHFV